MSEYRGAGEHFKACSFAPFLYLIPHLVIRQFGPGITAAYAATPDFCHTTDRNHGAVAPCSYLAGTRLELEKVKDSHNIALYTPLAPIGPDSGASRTSGLAGALS